MFNNITLRSFKSFVNEDIELKPLTLLTGLNSSGKSSVIQSIRMIDRKFRSQSPLIEGHGDFSELHNSYKHDDMLIKLSQDSSYFKIQVPNKGSSEKTCDSFEKSSFPVITFIGADRLGAQPNMPISLIGGIGEKGENVLSVLYDYAEKVLDERLKTEYAEGYTFDYVVNGWLQYISPKVKFTYKVDRSSDISSSKFNGHRATNVGFGLSYTLPIIVALLASTLEENAVVLIENPEAHLHPKGQTEMAKLIAKCVECGSQVIVETHSDHLVDGLRIYCKKNPGFNKKVITHWFELDESNNTKVQTISFTEDGKFSKTCPPGFFDQFEINAEELLF